MKNKSKLVGPLLLVMAQYMNQIISPLVSLLVVRYLGAEQFGLYASAMAITTLLSVLPDFGLQQSALNLNARREWTYSQILKKSLRIGLIYSVITYVIVALWMSVINYNEITIYLSYMMGATFFRISLVTVITTGLQIKGEYGKIAIWNGIISATQWITTLLLIMLNAQLYVLILVPIIVSLSVSIAMLIIEGLKLNLFIKNSGPLHELIPTKQLLNGSWQFGLASSMHQLYYKSDVAVMSVYRAPIEVGQYTVAFRLVELFFLFPGVVFNQVLYPKYCIWLRDNISKLKLYYSIMNKIMICSGLIITIMLVLFGQDIIRIIFGDNQSGTTIVLALLACSIPIRFWASSVGAVLTNDRLIKIKLKLQTGVAILSLSLNLLLIPKFGQSAAAINMLITQLTLLVVFSYAAERYLFGFRKIKINDWLPPVIITICSAGGIFIVNQDSSNLIKIIVSLILISFTVVISLIWLKRHEIFELTSLLRKEDTLVRHTYSQ